MKTLHIGLRVSDINRSLAFYTALGYEIVGQVAGTGIGDLTMLKLPRDAFVSLELVADPQRPTVEPGGFNHLVIQVESMDEAVAALTGRGVEAEPPTSPDESGEFWTAMVTDPDGYRIELVQWPPGHPDGMTREDFEGGDDTGSS